MTGACVRVTGPFLVADWLWIRLQGGGGVISEVGAGIFSFLGGSVSQPRWSPFGGSSSRRSCLGTADVCRRFGDAGKCSQPPPLPLG